MAPFSKVPESGSAAQTCHSVRFTCPPNDVGKTMPFWPAMTGNGLYIPLYTTYSIIASIKMVMTGGWFMIVLARVLGYRGTIDYSNYTSTISYYSFYDNFQKNGHCGHYYVTMDIPNLKFSTMWYLLSISKSNHSSGVSCDTLSSHGITNQSLPNIVESSALPPKNWANHLSVWCKQ